MTPLSLSISETGVDTLIFPDSRIENLRIDRSASMIADSLAVDQLTCDLLVDSDSAARQTFTQLGAFHRNLAVVTLTYGSGSSAIRSRFRFAPPALRTGKRRFRITAVSPLALLDDSFHNGGLYRGASLEFVLQDILRSAYSGAFVVGIGILNELSDSPNISVKDLPVSGYLPRAKRRENLQRLLMATGTILWRTAGTAGTPGGELAITIPRLQPTGTLDNSRVFLGGSVSCGERNIVRAEVTEHEYTDLDTDRVVTLFDNSATQIPASGDQILFSQAPVHSLTAKKYVNGELVEITDGNWAAGDLTIDQAHCNFAVVSGRGVLEGKLYTHQTRLVSVSSVSPDSGRDNTASVTDNGLIHSGNADAVARRLLAWYNADAVVQMDMIHDSPTAWPLPGTLVAFTDPFGDARTGYITEMNGKVTSFERAALTLVSGYFPPAPGDSYDTRVILDALNSTWTAARDMRVRILLIGGGSGGASGCKGADASKSSSGRYAGKGGSGGSGGSGARLRVLTLDLTQNTTVTITQPGPGGQGGGYNDNKPNEHIPGAVGGDAIISVTDSVGHTTIYSTGDTDGGTPLYFTRPEGVHDLLDYHTVYAKDGPEGLSGNLSGQSQEPLTDPLGNLWSNGNQGADSENGQYSGGDGGGAAVGANGGNGGRGGTSRGGSGGNGADALAHFRNIAYGCGGSGGHGGGAGGMGGAHNTRDINYGDGGTGGKGSDGQNGKHGAAVIYYKGGGSNL